MENRKENTNPLGLLIDQPRGVARDRQTSKLGSLACLRIETELNAVIRHLQQGATTPKISIW